MHPVKAVPFFLLNTLSLLLTYAVKLYIVGVLVSSDKNLPLTETVYYVLLALTERTVKEVCSDEEIQNKKQEQDRGMERQKATI